MNNLFQLSSDLLAAGEVLPSEEAKNGLEKIMNQTFMDNELWRFGVLLIIIIATLIVGRIVRFIIDRAADKLKTRPNNQLLQVLLKCLAGPAALGIFAAGVFIAKWPMEFATDTDQIGFSHQVEILWNKVSRAIVALAVAYFMFRLVDIIEFYLKKQSKLVTDT